MALNKITEGQINTYGVAAAPDKLTGTADENKKLFDKLVREVVKASLNNLVDALMAYTGADEIGAQMEGFSTITIQGALDKLKEDQDENTADISEVTKAVTLMGDDVAALQREIDNRYTKTEMDAILQQAAADVNATITSETDPLVESISYADGVLTVTKKDGTQRSMTIDTECFVQNVASTDTIGMTVGNGGVVTSYVKDGSIGTTQLADAAVTPEKLQGGSVTSAKLANNSVQTSKLVSGAVTSEKLASDVQEAINGKQETLISGENIKTVNGQSLLGGGDITIEGGGTVSWNDLTDRPFYDNSTVYYEAADDYVPIETVVFDGDTYYKVSNTALSKEELLGLTVVRMQDTNGDGVFEDATHEISEETCTINDYILNLRVLYNGSEELQSIFEDIVMSDGSTSVTLTTGLWVVVDANLNGVNYKTTKLYRDELVTIPEKYLPEIDGLPEVTEADNGKILVVVNGEWKVIEVLPDNAESMTAAQLGRAILNAMQLGSEE